MFCDFTAEIFWNILYRYQIPFDWPYHDTRKLFREPSVLTDYDKLELKWTDPDEEVINFVKFLVCLVVFLYENRC